MGRGDTSRGGTGPRQRRSGQQASGPARWSGSPGVNKKGKIVAKSKTLSQGTGSLIPPWWVVGCLLGLLVALWSVWPWVMFQFVAWFPDKAYASAGPLGDLYGAFNALVSSLTLLCLLYTLWQQQRDLTQTREALRQSLNMQGLLEEIGFPSDPDRWTAPDWDDVERVCHTFQFVGILVESDLLDRDLIFSTWGRPIQQCWEKVRGIQTNTSRGYALPYRRYAALYRAYLEWKEQRQVAT
jgi:hypothetical protein